MLKAAQTRLNAPLLQFAASQVYTKMREISVFKIRFTPNLAGVACGFAGQDY